MPEKGPDGFGVKATQMYHDGIEDVSCLPLAAWRIFPIKCASEVCDGHVVISCDTQNKLDINLVLTPKAARELRAAIAPALHDLADDGLEWLPSGMLAGKLPLETNVTLCRIDAITSA